MTPPIGKIISISQKKNQISWKIFFYFTEPVNINPTPVHDPASTDQHTSDSSQPNDHPGEAILQTIQCGQ